MAEIIIHEYSADFEDFIIEYLKLEVQKYHLNQLTGGNDLVSDVINVVEAHPVSIMTSEAISIATAAQTPENASAAVLVAKLPMIGVVGMDENEERQTLGGGESVGALAKTFFQSEIANVQSQARWRGGVLAANSDITLIADYFTNNPSKTQIPCRIIHEVRRPSIKISIWSQHPYITRLLKHIVRSAMLSLRIAAKSKFDIISINSVGNLYNYDFGFTMYGYDFNIDIRYTAMNYHVDLDFITVRQIDESPFTEQNNDEPANPVFKALNRDDKYKDQST